MSDDKIKVALATCQCCNGRKAIRFMGDIITCPVCNGTGLAIGLDAIRIQSQPSAHADEKSGTPDNSELSHGGDE